MGSALPERGWSLSFTGRARLRSARKILHLTEGQLASGSQLSTVTLDRIQSGKSVSLTSIKMLFKYLYDNININDNMQKFKQFNHNIDCVYNKADYRLVRGSKRGNPKQNFTAQDLEDISIIYEAMLTDDRLQPYIRNYETTDTIKEYLSMWDEQDCIDEESFYVLAYSSNNVCSYMYGDLHKTDRSFSVWYIVNPRRAHCRLPDDYPELRNAANADHLANLTLCLLKELVQTDAADCLMFELDGEDVASPRGRSRGLLRLYAKGEEALLRMLGTTQSSHLRTIASTRMYVHNFDYFVPNRHGEEVVKTREILCCMPLKPENQKIYASSRVPYEVVRNSVISSHQMYYDFYEGDEPIRKTTEKMSSEIISQMDDQWAGKEVAVVTVAEFLEELQAQPRQL